MITTQTTARYRIESLAADGARYFLQRIGQTYGMWVRDIEARQLRGVLDACRDNVHLDEAVHQFYEHHARQLDDSGMIRPLN